MISERVIDLAWSQLQQLPSPMVEEPRMVRDSTNIEFGELDESESYLDRPETHREQFAAAKSGQAIADLDDIVVEGASELWLDDHEESPILESEALATESSDEFVDTPSDQSVFGDFEMEEDIAVGTGVSRQPTRAAEPPANLEQALHQEIVGLNHYMAEILNQPVETNAFVDAEESLDDTLFADSEPEQASEECLSAVDDEEAVEERQPQQQASAFEQPASPAIENPEEIEQREAVKSPHSIYWIGEEEPVSETDTGNIGRDDSDLLVIEDEIEVRRVDAAKRYDALDQTISVDFQAMLSRMRSGSNS
jgi:hypothetical protein